MCVATFAGTARSSVSNDILLMCMCVEAYMCNAFNAQESSFLIICHVYNSCRQADRPTSKNNVHMWSVAYALHCTLIATDTYHNKSSNLYRSLPHFARPHHRVPCHCHSNFNESARCNTHTTTVLFINEDNNTLLSFDMVECRDHNKHNCQMYVTSVAHAL